MARGSKELSGYKGMWLFATFDLPVDTRKARRTYTQFRKLLLREGFMMLQYSVYARYCPGEESSRSCRRHVRNALPNSGRVRMFSVTDRQFEKMEVFDGKSREPVEEPPPQFMLF